MLAAGEMRPSPPGRHRPSRRGQPPSGACSGTVTTERDAPSANAHVRSVRWSSGAIYRAHPWIARSLCRLSPKRSRAQNDLVATNALSSMLPWLDRARRGGAAGVGDDWPYGLAANRVVLDVSAHHHGRICREHRLATRAAGKHACAHLTGPREHVSLGDGCHTIYCATTGTKLSHERSPDVCVLRAVPTPAFRHGLTRRGACRFRHAGYQFRRFERPAIRHGQAGTQCRYCPFDVHEPRLRA